MKEILISRGVFSSTEWSHALGAATRSADRTIASDTSAEAVMSAIRNLLAEREIASPLHLDALTDAWSLSAYATPHGEPLELSEETVKSILTES